MKRLALVAGSAGLLAFVLLLLHYGLADILAALAATGLGILWILLYRAPSLALMGLAWRPLYPAQQRPSIGRIVLARWICESVNGLLPVAQIGGDLVRARLAARPGQGAQSAAAVVIDMTVALIVEILFALGALGLLLGLGIGGGLGPMIALLILGAGAVGAFVVAQRRGLFGALAALIARAAGAESWKSLIGGAKDLDGAIAATYRHRSALLTCALWHVAATTARVGETALGLWLLGAGLLLAPAFIIENLAALLRSAAFIVPGGLGVQEGSLVALGNLLGLSAEISLALGLIKRVRELVVGGLGLIALAALSSKAGQSAREH
ncbi:MAG: flippase-like domain-containing protein [Rhodospirillales bacterium]|nr:flippase-like domain-containing protein [Rhodospirillales bacterium]